MANFWTKAFKWPQKLLSGDGRDELYNDIRNGTGYASVGNPLHGLTAGYKITKAFGDPRRPFKNIKEQIDNPGADTFKEQYDGYRDRGSEAWGEGKYPVFFAAGNYLGGAQGMGSSGSISGGATMGAGEGGTAAAAGGSNAGAYMGAANAGGGLLGAGGQPQQGPPAQFSQPVDVQAQQRRQMMMQQQMQLQALRQKPNKTPEEWAMLQRETKNQGLLGNG